MKRAYVLAIVAVACAAAAGTSPKTRPDIALPSHPDIATEFVVWEQETALGDTDIYLLASFDGGCTWCGPLLWATGPDDESSPRVAFYAIC
ncbi:hypothetical protein ACFLU6_12130 [Acidobacteriota bacterium]